MRRRASIALAVAATGCAGGSPSSATSAATSSTTSSMPAPTAEGRAGGGAATVFAMGVDATRRACERDADCQVIGSCDCVNCIPSKRMEVQMCERPCPTDPCAGIRPTCDHRLCSNGGGPARSSPTAAVVDELSAAGQLVLDDRRVAAYFHERERPERSPLVVAWEPGMPHPRWTKFGRPVEIVDGLPGAQPYLLPTLVSVDERKASFNFWYEPEGALIAAELAKRDGAWSIVSVEIAERKQ